MTQQIFLFGFLFGPVLVVAGGRSGNSLGITWVTGKASEIPLMGLEPIGLEDSTYSYLCRAKHEGQHPYYPGKLIVDFNKCYYSVKDKEYFSGTYEILNAPSGTLSWIPFNETLTPNAILVGAYYEVRTYACRGWVQGKLVPGTYLNDGSHYLCYKSLDGIVFPEGPDFEILAKNGYAVVKNL